MGSWRHQRGELSIGCLLGAAVLVAVVFIAIKTVPEVLRVGDLQKEIELVAERANLARYRDDKVLVGRILDKAETLHLPLRPENIKINRTRSDISIVVTYDLDIKYPGYVYHWHKVHDVQRPLF